MQNIVQIFACITSLSILIISHELGHFILAKLLKIKVEKFFLFFNPYFSIFKKKIGETLYGVGWIPLGGYIQIDTICNYKNICKQIIVIISGPIMNIILSIIIFTLLSLLNNQPLRYKYNKIKINNNYYEEEYIKQSHNINSYQEKNIITIYNNARDLIQNKIKKNCNLQSNQLLIKKQNINIYTKKNTFINCLLNNVTKNNIYSNIKINKNIIFYNFLLNKILQKQFDVTCQNQYKKTYIYHHVKIGFKNTYKSLLIQLFYIKEIILFNRQAYKKLSSVLTIVNIFPLKWNWYIFWYLTANMSIWLSIINLIPMPSLDGGYILINIIQFITKKSMQDNILIQLSNIIGFLTVMITVLIIMIKDIITIFN